MMHGRAHYRAVAATVPAFVTVVVVAVVACAARGAGAAEKRASAVSVSAAAPSSDGVVITLNDYKARVVVDTGATKCRVTRRGRLPRKALASCRVARYPGRLVVELAGIKLGSTTVQALGDRARGASRVIEVFAAAHNGVLVHYPPSAHVHKDWHKPLPLSLEVVAAHARKVPVVTVRERFRGKVGPPVSLRRQGATTVYTGEIRLRQACGTHDLVVRAVWKDRRGRPQSRVHIQSVDTWQPQCAPHSIEEFPTLVARFRPGEHVPLQARSEFASFLASLHKRFVKKTRGRHKQAFVYAVSGYASRERDDKRHQRANMLLSNRRAETVTALLRSLGKRGSVVWCGGFGDGRPKAANTTEWGRRINRSAEIVAVPADHPVVARLKRGCTPGGDPPRACCGR